VTPFPGDPIAWSGSRKLNRLIREAASGGQARIAHCNVADLRICPVSRFLVSPSDFVSNFGIETFEKLLASLVPGR
jgi:hypothetical protein